jgi:nucleoside-diphosphate-sugar epimerase
VRILCLGGTGFIGSHLEPVLIARDHEVVSLGHEDGDLTRRGTTQVLIESNSPDLVVHLAAQPGRVFGEIDPSHTVQTNVVATINVARTCTELGTRLCYISTSEIYGDIHPMKSTSSYGFEEFGMRRPLSEEYAGQGRPRNLYGLTKWWGEQACQLYAPKDLLVIRPTMPYGPTMTTGYGRAALPTMIDNLLHCQSFTVNRNTYRSWCYIDDLVRGMADVIEHGEGVYNVGRDDDLRSMQGIAALVCDLLDADPRLIILGEHDETITPVKDISCARLRSLGWAPEIDLEDGIMRVAESLRVS